jgi:hypothetical protein
MGSNDEGRVTADAGTLQAPRKVLSLRVGAARAVVARRSDKSDRAIMMNVNWE